MKKFIYSFGLLVLIFVNGDSSAQIPTYTLTATNFVLTSPSPADSDNVLEFDIYVLHTSSAVGGFEYAGGQYFINFNQAILNGGTGQYSIIGSDLPANMQPRTPSIAAVSGVWILRLEVNTFPGAGAGFSISPTFPGTKIVRMKLRTTALHFAIGPNDTANFRWRNPPSSMTSNPRTIVFAYVPAFNPPAKNLQITPNFQPDPPIHIIGPYPNPLPVELTSFTSNVNRNNVTLKWTTANETNNSRFDIERSIVNGEWSMAGFVQGSGTTNESKNYSFNERINTGKYKYRLKQIDFNGNYKYYELSNEVEVGVPKSYDMSQNYPNPFNPNTLISYQLAANSLVSIIVYDISGKEVVELIEEKQDAGYYAVKFNATNLSSGMYFYRITADDFVSTKKMMLLK